MKLSELCQRYVQRDPESRPATQDLRKHAFAHLIKSVRDKEIENLSVEDCDVFKGDLLKTCSRSGANSYLRSVRKVFNWSVERKLMATNPLAVVRDYKTAQKEIQTISDEDFERLLGIASPLWQVRLLAGRQGLRRGEVLNLTQNDFDEHAIYIRPKEKTDRTWPWWPKDLEIRYTPMAERLRILLQEMSCYYPALSEDTYRSRLQDVRTNRRKCRDWYNCPDYNFNLQFRRLRRAAALADEIEFRHLRSTFITATLEAGASPQLAMKWAGHSRSDTMFRYYAAVRDKHEAEVLYRLNNKKGPQGNHNLTTPEVALEATRLGGIGLEPTTFCL